VSPSELHSASVIAPKPNFPLSPVDLLLSVLAFSRSSQLLSLLCGGVRGDCLVTLFGGSVGRNTAGTYRGDFGGLSCRVCAGRCGGGPGRGEVGEALFGVAAAELTGEICCDCGLYRVYCDGDAVNCGTGIAKSVAITFVGR
jgi:hypothetical protein